VGTIAMPLRNLVGTLNAVPRKMVQVIEAIRKKKEEEEAA
jgi:ribosomal protein L10